MDKAGKAAPVSTPPGRCVITIRDTGPLGNHRKTAPTPKEVPPPQGLTVRGGEGGGRAGVINDMDDPVYGWL